MLGTFQSLWPKHLRKQFRRAKIDLGSVSEDSVHCDGKGVTPKQPRKEAEIGIQYEPRLQGHALLSDCLHLTRTHLPPLLAFSNDIMLIHSLGLEPSLSLEANHRHPQRYALDTPRDVLNQPSGCFSILSS